MRQHFSTGGVLVNSQNQVYLTYKKSRDEWALPKGTIEPGESRLETALREVKEETGYQDIEPISSEPVHTATWVFTREENEQQEQKTTHYFLFRLKGGRQVQTSEMKQEGLGGSWFSFKEALGKASFDNVREVLQMAERKLS